MKWIDIRLNYNSPHVTHWKNAPMHSFFAVCGFKICE